MRSGTLRIIAGQWRGRKLKFPAIAALRPTPDRVRETVFNWLAPFVQDACCLDLFAGSGALGLEALSRGAKHVTFADQSPRVTKYLQALLNDLGAADQSDIFCLKVECRANIPFKQPFDLVFLDPPFRKGMLEPCCVWLEQKKMLAVGAHIYIETEAALQALPIPPNWQILKSKMAGQVRFYLVRACS